jgi:hypothetical protein
MTNYVLGSTRKQNSELQLLCLDRYGRRGSWGRRIWSVSAMERHGDGQRTARKSAWLPQMDRLLLAGMKHGPEGIRLARKQLRQLVPTLTPGEIWKRMRNLREIGSNGHRDPSQWPEELLELLKEGYENGGARKKAALQICRQRYPGIPSYVISRFANNKGWLRNVANPVVRKMHRPWSKHEDEMLWRLAGYDSVRQISQKLRRTESAVRYRLKARGLSGKVKDGISLRAFQEIFHIGHRKGYSLIAKGMLRVRDARITPSSLAEFCQRHRTRPEIPVISNSQKPNGAAGLSWERVAGLLRISLHEVQVLIGTQQLKVVDTFVTEKAMEEFCRSCGKNGGPKLNYRLLDPKILDWLRDFGMQVPISDVNPAVNAFEKQALVKRSCGKCRKEFRGNVYFAHIKGCKGEGEGRRILSGETVGKLTQSTPRSMYRSAS